MSYYNNAIPVTGLCYQLWSIHIPETIENKQKNYDLLFFMVKLIKIANTFI